MADQDRTPQRSPLQEEYGELPEAAPSEAAAPVVAPPPPAAPAELGPPTIHSVLRLALPTFGEQILIAAVGITDFLIAGHIPGDANTVAAASAAVGMMGYLQWLANIMASAFGVGATAIVARAIGARRPRVAHRVAGTSMVGGFLVSVVCALLMFFFADPLVRVVGLDGQAHVFGVQYLRIMVITIALQTIYQIGLSCLRGAGDTFRPFLLTFLVALVNIFTSSSFTFGFAPLGIPAWGIQGNAFGTMIAYLLGGVGTMAILLSGRAVLKLQLRHFRLIPHVITRVLRISIPNWLEGTLLWAGQAFIVVMVINRNDAAVGVPGVTLAAHTAAIRIESLAYLPGFAFGIAASALVGQYLGARQPEHARRAAHLANRLAIGMMAAAALPMVLFPRFLLGLMVNSPPVVDLGVIPLMLAGLAQPGFAVAIVMSSALRGAGDTIQPLIATLTGIFVVRIVPLFICLAIFNALGHPAWGLIAVWIGILLDLNYRGLYAGLIFRRGRWVHKKV